MTFRPCSTVAEVRFALRLAHGDDLDAQLNTLAQAYLEAFRDGSKGFRRESLIAEYGPRLVEIKQGVKSSAKEPLE